MKKIISLFLIIISIFTLSACTQDVKEDLSIYDYTELSERQFQFKTFIGVPSKLRIYNAKETSYYIKELTDEEFDTYYKEMAEAGFTIASAPYSTEDTAHNLRMLDAAKKYGLKQLLGEMINPQGISLTFMLQGRFTDPMGNEYANYTDQQIKDLLNEFFEPYKDHEAFYGFALWDEPGLSYFDNIARAKALFEEVLPGKLLYVNLLPLSASINSLQVPHRRNELDYINGYLEKVDTHYISYCAYPFVDDQDGNKNLVDSYLYNMQVYRQAASKSDRELWTYLLSTGHLHNNSYLSDILDVADIRWQVNTFMAFGGDSISWFTYFPPPPVDSHNTFFDVGPYDRQGRKTDVYYYIKHVHSEVKTFEKVYFNFKWQNIILAMGDENKDGFVSSFDYLDNDFGVKTHSRINSYKVQQDALIGIFKDNKGNDAFMVTNFSNPGELLTSRVEIDFKDSYAAVIYSDGNKYIVKLNDGKLAVNLRPGGAAFIIPVAQKEAL